MGYRLAIEKCKMIYYNTKLFGYVEKENLKSLKYLIDIDKLSEDVQFEYGIDNEIVLNGEQMKKFIKLYNEDLNNFNFYSNEKDRFINNDTIQNILKDIEEEQEHYVLWWL